MGSLKQIVSLLTLGYAKQKHDIFSDAPIISTIQPTLGFSLKSLVQTNAADACNFYPTDTMLFADCHG